METILNFNEPLDVATLDKVVEVFYRGSGSEQQMAQKLLTQFQEHPDAWTRVDFILEYSANSSTKYIGLQILEKLIQTRWKVLPRDQCEGIKTYIVSLIIKKSQDDQTLNKEKTFVNKLNLILVQILKQEWPHNWPTFIPEIVGASKTNETLCENNMKILKLLSEEIFDYSAEQMVQEKVKNLKNQLCQEFSEISQLCSFVLENATKPSLTLATLDTLLRFLLWIPLGYIFETDLIKTLVTRFLSVPTYRNATLKCLTEIGSLNVVDSYEPQLVFLFHHAMMDIANFMPLDRTNIAIAYNNGSHEEQMFLQNLTLFICGLFKEHLPCIEKQYHTDNKKVVVETANSRSSLELAHLYLLKLSEIEEREIFKICLEYWIKLVSDLYHENPFGSIGTHPLSFGGAVPGSQWRRLFYDPVLSQLRLVMINRMVKPEEVLIVENDEGEIVKEVMKDTDAIIVYKSMKECLVYLTHLDNEDTENIMVDKLRRQVDGSEWSWNNLNKLCWAIGSISGAMHEDDEKRFLVTVIKDLLMLCEMKRGKDNKAVVASNIMYVVGQYPTFLRAHWKFLKTVINKLFEFMHETHEGVQDMACETFIKIAQKTRRHFVILQTGEMSPFIDEILSNISNIISDLQPSQIHIFYEAVGHMIQAQNDKATQERLIVRLMEPPNTAWDVIISQAGQNIETLKDLDTIKNLGNVLKTNVAACSSIGHGYITQLGRVFLDMLNLYRAVSQLISAGITASGPIAARTPIVRGMRTIKKETLKLLETFVSKNEDSKLVVDNFVPSILEAILGDYKDNVPVAREPEVLTLVATLFDNLETLMADKVPAILDAIFESTLNMINKDFEEFPEHRVGFFNLIRSIVQHCFNALFQVPGPQFKLMIDSIVWGFKHTMRDIGDLALSVCFDLLTNISHSELTVRNSFYQSYFLPLLQDILYVLTDADHKSGFKMQGIILAHMLASINDGLVTAPLFDPSQFPGLTDNASFLKEYITNLLQTAFSHLQRSTVQHFVYGFFELNKDHALFKSHLRDFLISLKEFSTEDNTDLFREEREKELEMKKRQEYEAAMKIPGMIKPSERTDDMAE